ncbi:MAG: carboxylesterase family protein [Clostridia bacterium]|nr:carboxylesterase family protein [Clostridia bacterium]
MIDGSYDAASAVRCSNGTFVGRREGDVRAFKGIPYAEAPTGALRWKPPVDAKDGDTVREAYYFGPSPIQTEWPSEVGSYYPQSEDCLTLNIWTNCAESTAGKSVLVFFHGGSYGWGATSDPIYDGRNLTEKYSDLILVSVEYRLGIFGFVDFSSVPGGADYAESGNLGLLDQVCALRWIRKNIAAFGGDPDNVTIFGESAGAGSVSLLPLMEGTAGLFRRVIAESGSVALTYSRAECQNLTRRLLDATGCKSMDELTALSEDTLKEINASLNDYNNFPERDGVVLPEDLYAAYETGACGKFEMLIGTNADEVRYWINEMGYYVPGVSGALLFKACLPIMFENNLQALDRDEKVAVDAFLALQSGGKTRKLTEFYNELLFRVPAMKQAALLAGNGNRVYTYYWTYPCADKTIGACHAVELSYVFNNPQVTIYTGGNYNEQLAEAVQNLWVNFARTGNPDTQAIRWAPYSADRRSTLILGDEIRVENDLKAAQRSLIEPLLGHYFNGCYAQLSMNVPQVYFLCALLLAPILAAAGCCLLIRRRRKKKRKTAAGQPLPPAE